MATQTSEQEILDLMTKFGDAFNRHDVDAIMECMTYDCVFISRHGQRIEGSDNLRAFWTKRLLEEIPDIHFEETDHFICGNRGFYEWNVTSTENGQKVQKVACDIFTYRDGKVAIKDYYVKWPSN